MKIRHNLLFLFIAISFSLNLHAQSYTINTIAGNGTAGYTGDWGNATAAEINKPLRVTMDRSGNLYISDWRNSVIRKVNNNGIITTCAGNHNYGYSGDGGVDTDAELSYQYGVVTDRSGNLYICDEENNVIRKVNTNGIISTIAGNGTLGYSGDNGPATDVELYYPGGISIDTLGDIFIAEVGNNVIRKVSSNGIISTLAGKGYPGYSGDGEPATDAVLNGPNAVFTDNAGNVYFTDYWNNRVREINSTGIVNTIIGNGKQGYSGDGGLATAADLYGPCDITLDNTGNIYFADLDNNVIREVTTDNIIVTIAGNGIQGFWGDGGPATAAELNNPNGVFVDSLGNIYINDVNNNRIRELTVCKRNLSIGSASSTICSGQSVVLVVSGAGSGYTWSPSASLSASTGDSVNAFPIVTTTYTITSNDSLGCTSTGTEVVNVIPSPNKPTFYQHCDTLTSSSQYDNQWYMDGNLLINDTSQNLIINNTSPDQYWVEVNNEANGCSTTSDTLTTSGIQQLANISNQLSIYPNPFNSIIFIQINSSAKNVKDWNLQITDVLGQTVYTQSSLNYINTIDLSNLSSGVYFITVINKMGRAVFPVVRQN